MSFEWGATRITPHRFESFLKFLKGTGYTCVPLQSLYNPKFIHPSKPIILTFDDSYDSIYKYAWPIMKAYDFTGTVFVISGYVGKSNSWDVNLGGRLFRHLKWDHIKNLSEAGFEIGSHTVHHPDLTRIKINSVRQELLWSKRRLEDKIGTEIHSIAYPFGRYDERIVDLSLETGYKIGFGAVQRKRCRSVKESFVFERKTCYLFDGLWNLRAKVDKTFWTELENIKLRVINFCSYGTSIVKTSQKVTQY